MTKTTTFVDYYQILNLPFGPSTSLTKQQLKLAYHKALLRHHPDKAGPITQDATLRATSASTSPSSQDKFTIDEITAAYKTLTDPSLRAEYDRVLRLDRVKGAEREKTGDVFHTGLEVVDLEDLGCDESGEEIVWFRGCRCGDERGFLVSEDELEKEVEHGEIVVGCRGCSLWLKVLFAVEDDG
ncbi:DnaJ-domain-containing protein [Penicillium cosmopolitanum]|uniref:Diphthamide biosynthesis protein 4 n=1 Tax=Penicillium cosmopolitanum TaxID=1131564 RepID=A0A9W9SI55_9EURO|nr:DnaJ-domain-containing protein [Penicillium cosmopolitanum]KAJ5376678.1 DnaJ-domain-containing protein [Penicillium cosmopolitanum]